MSEEAGFDTWEQDGDWFDPEPWDDDPLEPNCWQCGDSGWIFDLDRETGRVCRACTPSRFRLWRWRVTGWFDRFRPRRQWSDEEGPF